MAEKPKGIRVNVLAKELGVESKSILQKLRDEGIPNAPINPQATIALGLAESVREWHAAGQIGGGGGGVALEAPPKPAKAKSAAKPKRKPDAASDEPAENLAVADTAAPTPKVDDEDVSAAPIPATPPEAPTVAPEVVITAPPAPLTPEPSSPAAAPVAPRIAAEAPAIVTPPPVAAPPRVVATAATGIAGDPLRPPVQRPTIRLSDRAAPPPVERKTVTPAPQLNIPAPAQIQGPRVVREEKPDIVSAPRARANLRPAPGAPGPGYSTARPVTGRGVKIVEDEEGPDKKGAAGKAGAAGRTNSNRRRGPDGRRGEAMEKLKEFTEADLIARRDALNAAVANRRALDSHIRTAANRGTHQQAKAAFQKGEPVAIEEPITVKTLSAALGVKVNDIISRLMKQGVFATINQVLDPDAAGAIALTFGVELQIAQQATLEDLLMQELDARVASTESQRPRPPVVTILGHVDHGKTSLLDKIRSANVAAGEAGGITQHTAAWMVGVQGGDGQTKRVTFIDTPGHQAFTSMRARGANMTDVVVLVVSAAEGVQPQTIESINHARAAGVPIVVALNKIDRADANPDMVLGQLAAQNLNPVEWGGDTEVVRTSATTGQGVKELIEVLDYQAELLELKADPTASARGTVIESKVDEGLGPVATVLVQDGMLHVGDIILSGPGHGRIRVLYDDNGKPIQEAGPSTPVIVSGLDDLPAAGDKFYVLDDLDRTRAIAEERAMLARQSQLGQQNRVTADNLLATIAAGDVQTINLIIKADVQGSVETLVNTVTGQNTEEVKVRVIHSGVGTVSESDVELAMATKAKPTDNRVAIIGFHVTVDDTARALAEQNHIDVKLYRVIYEIFDDLKKALSGMLSKEVREKIHGHAEIRQVFKASKIGNIAGCMCTDGHILRTDKIRLIRDGKVITEGLTLESLRRVKEDVREVKSGFECGIKIAGYDDVKQGDRLEAYITEEFERTL